MTEGTGTSGASLVYGAALSTTFTIGVGAACQGSRARSNFYAAATGAAKGRKEGVSVASKAVTIGGSGRSTTSFVLHGLREKRSRGRLGACRKVSRLRTNSLSDWERMQASR